MDLNGKRALVMGACRELGKAIAQPLAAEGEQVIEAARGHDRIAARAEGMETVQAVTNRLHIAI